MTKEEIIEMARQVGFEEHQAKFDTRFEPFAKLVAKRTWVGLTDDERQDIALEVPIDAVLITEAKLKDKNL